ncbi:cell division protein FtsQ [Arachidicoccus rhizosphaerae]|uniref:Cell division protein FtsQ n=1 Tax=Arachidicoccus rhizosphaerae TaxID=551991 RepID=A0A1H3Y263_9BACT|nr:hypothetical protein [Arachidicoccus rhizosphaerae]SEA04912.1 cell division protein FtsQ [Arachidicoccus rhizosphaerae]
MVKKKLILIIWLLLGFGAAALFFIGAGSKEDKLCQGINVEISRKARQVFTDIQGVKQNIAEAGGKPGIPVGQINLSRIENNLQQNPWISHIKLYFDNDQVLQAVLEETDPIARIFTVSGKSFYLDSGAHFLPTNRNIVARIPVFTGFPSDKKVLSHPDSLVLQDIKTIASFVIQDTFWNSFIAQVNYDPAGGFELQPTVGNQVIRIGNAEALDSKFNRLYSFYRQVIARTGLDAYKEIDVQYQGQVVAIPAGKSTQAATAQPAVTADKATGIPPPAVITPKKTTAPPKAKAILAPAKKTIKKTPHTKTTKTK